jgi:hypothetical protein
MKTKVLLFGVLITFLIFLVGMYGITHGMLELGLGFLESSMGLSLIILLIWVFVDKKFFLSNRK